MESSTSDIQSGAPAEKQAASVDLSIADLELRARAKDILIDAGISTVGDAFDALESGGDEALLELEGFDPESLVDLKKQLEVRGFSLPEGISRPSPEEPAEEAIGEPLSMLSIEPLPFGQRLKATWAVAVEQIGLRTMVYGLVGLLVAAALFLPPMSLLDRLGIVGYEALSADSNVVSHPDGLTLSVDAETFARRVSVRLESVPRLKFLEGSAGRSLRQAVEALPGHLKVKSPYYQIRARGRTSQPMLIDVVVPNNADPWETLDLYTWTGEAWEWVGSDLHTEVAGQEFVRARVTELPRSIVVVQTDLTTSTISAYLEPDVTWDGVEVLDRINPTGLLLGTMGGFAGSLDDLPYPGERTNYTVLPTLRNWAPGGKVNRGLLSDLLTTPEVQETHIANVVQLCREKGLEGVDVSYRGVAPGERDAYTAFIEALAEALHAEGLKLTIAVERPTFTDGEWDTGGYDWAALGVAADALKVPFPEDPAAYTEGGEAQRLLDWATAQVSRYKLRMLVSSLSVEQGGGVTDCLSLKQALAPFGEIAPLDEVDRVEPNSQLVFELSGSLLSITPQEEAGTYRLEYEVDDGSTHTVWLGTAANLANKLRWAERYHLGGIAVADAFAPGNVEGIADVLAGYGTEASPAGQALGITWTVVGEGATVDQQTSPLTDPSYTWTASDATGVYTVGASIAGFDHGSFAITVAEPEREVAEVVTSTAALTSTDQLTPTTPAGDEGEAEDECLDARYVADVTIPDDTQLDNEEEFEKTWRVRNAGTCAWPEDTVIAFVSGSQMGAPDSVEVGAAEPGEEVEVSVPMKAPTEAGRYQSVWQMKMADGFFGGNLTVVIQAGEVATAPAPSAPPPSGGGAFELGGHVRDLSFPYADKMHYAGMTWAKVQIHYGQDASGIIAASHANGFKIQLSALGSANMVTKPGFEQDFANWVAGLAAAGADAIEVWNEPNIDREWQIGHISPQAYTNLLCTAYSAIKNANSGTAVISAAPSPTGYFGGCSPNGCDDAPWMAGLRDAGAAQCMDYLGAHHNGGATSPSARSGHPADQSGHHSWYFLPQTELYYSIFGGARKLFYTEMGYASQEGVPTFSEAFAWARGTNNAQQAAWLKEAAQLSISTGMVRCIIVWNIDFSRYGDDPQDGFAIIRPGGGCPACETLHSLLGTR